jgi:large subunit ribosomal protein L15
MAEKKDDVTAEKAPAKKAATTKVVAEKAPVKKAPVKAATAKVVAEKAPVKKAPVKAATAKVVAEKAPAKKAPVKAATAKVVAEKAPAKKAPVKAAAEKVPAEKAVAAKASPARKAPAKDAAAPAANTLKLHHLRPAPGAHTAKTRVGRGEAGARGKTAGRGTKGTKARYQVPARFEGGQMPLHMRLPKLRGFKNPFRTEYQVVNLDKLSALYPKGGAVTIEDLVAKGAVRQGSPVKVLGTGEITVKVRVAVDAYSASAKDKIVAAGGSIGEN